MAFFFADAEKAFNHLKWDFMFQLLEKMEFGEAFIDAIKAIYSEQQPMLSINMDYTDNFKVEKETRQGYPLSPLLFVLVLEVLLSRLMRRKKFKA